MNIFKPLSQRSSEVLRGVLASLLSRALYVFAPLLVVPLALQQLGVGGYGAWSAALSLTAIAGFADLGLGVGLMTKLAGALAKNDYGQARVLTSTTYLIAIVVFSTLLSCLWLSVIWVDWAAVIGGRGNLDRNVVLITLSVFLFNIVVNLIVRVQYASQQIGLSNLWQSIASIAGVLGVLSAVLLNVTAPVFVLLAGASQTFVLVLNTLYFFLLGKGKDFRPSLRFCRIEESRELISLGSRFLLISFLMTLSMSLDSFIIGNAAGLEVVTTYAIPARIFGVLSVIASAFSIPLWPANVEALRSGDSLWVRRTTYRMTLISGAAVLFFSILAVILTPWVFDVWINGKVQALPIMLWGFALLVTVQALSGPVFMVQNAAEILLPQTIAYLLMLFTLPLKWLVANQQNIELIPWITLAGYVVLVVPAALTGYSKALRFAS